MSVTFSTGSSFPSRVTCALQSLLRRATADVQLDEGKGPDLSSPTGTCGAFSVLVAAGQTLVRGAQGTELSFQALLTTWG